jgi:glycosyltransferase involved in cell wall biosynthesis
MGRRIFYDGLNLALPRGTGIATYTRVLAGLADGLGYEIGLFFGGRHRPTADALIRQIELVDPHGARGMAKPQRYWNDALDQIRLARGLRPTPVAMTGAVVADRFNARMPPYRHLFVARALFQGAARYFRWRGRCAELDFAVPPDILHCTYPMPIRAKGARNIYTIHDLIPLRLPSTTRDDKRALLRLLRGLAATADHIVTVSEQSRRDIIELLGIDAARVTNTYEAADLPDVAAGRSDDAAAEQIRGMFGLEPRGYLLFHGAIEPKKNVKALLDAYLTAAPGIPLVLAGGGGWGNAAELAVIERIEAEERGVPPPRRRVYRLGFVERPVLAGLIRGARAVVFPSLYEGFGLPVLEAMALGTPVVTSRVASLPEVAGEAALYVDPYDTDDIARAIKTIAADAGLRADLAERGRARAELFSPARYRERVADLYRRLS